MSQEACQTKPEHLVKRRLEAVRRLAAIYRCGTLRLSQFCLRDIHGPFIVSRPFFDGSLYLDLGRGNPQCMLYLQGERFIDERKIIRQLVRPGLAAIDIGANIGYYTLMLVSYVGREGRVFSVEPEPDNLLELQRNVERNQLSNVSVVAAAAAHREGVVGLAKGLNGKVVDQPKAELSVRAVPIDSLECPNTGFIKVDVEGYELPVLLGALRVIEHQRPNLFVEVHPPFQTNKADTGEVMRLVSEFYRNVVVWTDRPRSLMSRVLVDYSLLPRFKGARLPLCPRMPEEIFWVAATNN